MLVLILQAMAAGQATEGDVVNAATGAPVAGAFVSAQTLTGSQSVVVKTDLAGHFRLPAAVAPNMPVQVVHAGFLRSERAGPTDPGQEVSILRIELKPASVISGKVEDEEGYPVEGAMVQAVRYRMVKGERKLQAIAFTQSDDLGQYRLINLPAGRYWVHVGSGSAANWDRRYVAEYFPGTRRPEDTGQIVVDAGQERGGTDIRLTRYEGVTVSGRVEMPATAGAFQRPLWISLQADTDGLPEAFNVLRQTDGSFVVRHVPPGDYVLRAASNNYPPKVGELLAEQKLRAGGADERGVVLKPHEVQSVDLAGTVVVEGGGNPPPMYIVLTGVNGGNNSARSNEDGGFVLKGLMPGHYDMRVIPNTIVNGAFDPGSVPHASLPASARIGEQEVLRKGFDVDGSPGGPLVITVNAHPIEIDGKLVDASGAPVLGAFLALTSGESAGLAGSSTGTGGAFRFMVAKPGEYHIHLVDDRSDWDDPDYLEQHDNDFPMLKVEAMNPPLTLRLPAKEQR
ncbi:MAG: carboxypeptidase-like regulatory domain-containing protein [Bryobacteraceae bacterium]